MKKTNVVGGLVEEKDIGLEENGSGERELHLPSSRERSDGVLLSLIIETDLGEGVVNLLVVSDRRDSLVGLDPVEDADLGLGTVNVVGDIPGSNDVLGRETLDLAVDDGVHERRLSGSVSATETVSVSSLESEGGGVEENLGTVREREGTVAEILTLLLVVKDSGVGVDLGSSFLEVLLGDLERVGGRSETEEGDKRGLPSGLVKVSGHDEVGGDSRSVDEGGVVLLGGGEVELLVLAEDGGRGGGDLDLGGRSDVGSVRVGRDVSDGSEGGDGSVDDTSSLGVGDGLGDLDESGEELGDEGSDGVLVVDELGHVVGDDGDLSLGGGESLSDSSREKRDHEGEGGRVDLGNEGGSGKELDGLGDLLDRVDEGGDQSGDEPKEGRGKGKEAI
jgi:hypothetical protein